jgi:hypothetical protein
MYNNSKDMMIPAPELHIHMDDIGISINESKSGMVKQQGK